MNEVGANGEPQPAKLAGEADTWDFMGIKEETDNLLGSIGLGVK